MEAAYDNFCPEGVPAREKVIMTMDEYETIRLVDLEKCTHEQCAKQMGIARTTVTEIYESARYKMADSIVNGKTLEISGGNYRLCDGTALFCCNKICRRTSTSVGKDDIQRKETDQMRIAVTYENGEIFQHFGHTEQFKLYDIENSQVVRSQIVDTNGQGHGALAGFLTEAGADVLICGGIGGGAQSALATAGIKLYGGVFGAADEAVEAYLAAIRHAAFLCWHREGALSYETMRSCMVILSRMLGYEDEDIWEYLENSFERLIWDWGYFALVVS